jgi:hypothetical protein
MKRSFVPALLLMAALSSPAARGDDNAPSAFDPLRHMRVSEVKAGMKGYGLSVFQGTKIERFNVEVISVLRNFKPKNDVVLVRLSGCNLEHTGPIEGMSGSPIFLRDEQGRDRMIGAFAYGWRLIKDPIGGVEPIEYMLRIPTAPTKPAATQTAGAASARAPHGQTWSIDQVLPMPWKEDAPRLYPLASWNSDRVNPRLCEGDDDMRLRPLATPLTISGLSQLAFEQFQPILRAYGLSPLQAGAGGGAPLQSLAARIEPGSSLAVAMLSGDMEVPALGTCTEVIGNRVWGFGHPFLGEGNIALPMCGGYIHTVIPNLSASFKLGAPTATQGTLCSDQSCGVAGFLGQGPQTIPIDLRCTYTDGSLDNSYHFNAALHPRLLPMLCTLAVTAATTSAHDLPQYHTLDYDVNLEFANGQNVHVRNRTANTGIAEMMYSIGGPVMVALENPFDQVPLKKITGTIRVWPQAKVAEIESVVMPKSKYTPGETMKAFVRYRPFQSEEAFLPLAFKLPDDLPDGNYEFSVSDWQQYLTAEQITSPFRFDADNISEVFSMLRDLTSVRRDSIYMRLTRQPDGVAVGRTAMPRLPSYLRRVMVGSGDSNITTFVSSTVKSVPADYVMSGSARFTITIDRNAKVESSRPPRQPPQTPNMGMPGPSNPRPKPIFSPDGGGDGGSPHFGD